MFWEQKAECGVKKKKKVPKPHPNNSNLWTNSLKENIYTELKWTLGHWRS